MNDYQKYLFDLLAPWRPNPKYPTYPPYHEGLYLEDYFCDWYQKNNLPGERYYIPVFWTTCYVDNCFIGLQQALDKLDPSKSYFTVAQHDDAIRERLPNNTISFNAGGNGGGIPIPLICSPIREELKMQNLKKDIFCSFVGSVTHPIRSYLSQVLNVNSKYYFHNRQWTSSIPSEDLNNFIKITSRSVFALTPRGYGRSSFRLYEVMQLGTIPVFVYDIRWCPWDDEIDWNEFSVCVELKDIHNIDSILSSISEEKIKDMQSKLKYYWENYFTREAVCKQILKRL